MFKPTDETIITQVENPGTNGKTPKAQRPIAELSDQELLFEKATGQIGLNAWELAQRETPAVEWLVPNVIPMGSTLLCGRPKIGKSYLALQLAGAVACGTSMFGSIEVKKREVVYFCPEDGERRLGRRMEQIHLLPTKELHFLPLWERKRDIFSTCVQLCEGMPDLGLIILDPIACFRPLDERAGNAYFLEYEFLHKVHEIAERYQVAILAITHPNKRTVSDFTDAINGTNAWAGALDTLLVLERNRGENSAVLHITGRDVESPDLALQVDPDLGWNLLGDAERLRQSDERKMILEFMTEAVEPVSPAEIARALGRNPGTTGVVLRRMVKVGVVKRVEGKNGKYQVTPPSPPRELY